MSFEARENLKLAPWTTLGLGGETRWYARIESESDLKSALTFARDNQLAWWVLGEGSNVVVGDGGYAGLTLHMQMRGVQIEEHGRTVELEAQAGEPWDALVARSVQQEWAGLECLSGIPGLVGATPIQNVGAYGQEVSETIVSVRVYDALKEEVRNWTPRECAFAYRDSFFKRAPAGRFVVLSVRFALRAGGEPSVLYGELKRALSETDEIGRSQRVSLARVRDTVLRLRRGKAMVLDPEEPNSRSAGSFFTNPIVSVEQADKLTQRFAAMPRFAVTARDGSRQYKLAAAWLIEQAGFRKGTRRGDVGISERHALALVNYGNGTTRELLELASEIRRAVRQTFDVTLEPEPRLLGCSLPPL